MATYSFDTQIHYYLGGWGTRAFGSTSAGGPIAGVSNSSYRAIIGFTVKPGSNEKITSITLKIGLVDGSGSSTTKRQLGAYLYTSLDTAKSSVTGPPTGYVANAVQSEASLSPTASGTMVTLTWSGLSITTETTYYAWFYTSPSVYSLVWTGASGNCVAPTMTFGTSSAGGSTSTSFKPYRIYIDNGTKWVGYECYIDNGSKWNPYKAYIDS